jgi:hypothetical protein
VLNNHMHCIVFCLVIGVSDTAACEFDDLMVISDHL